MRNINNTYTSLGNQSSDNIIYTGNLIKCINVDCKNPRLTDVIFNIGQITCFNYDQINSLTSVNTYCKNIGCDSKTFINLFNTLFRSICTLENGFLNISIGEKPDIKYIGTCLDDNTTITIPENSIEITPPLINTQSGNIPYQRECLWSTVNGIWTLQTGVPNLTVDKFCFFKTDASCTACNFFELKDLYQNIIGNIQNLNYENYKIYKEICATKAQIFNSLNNIISQSGTIYLDDIILNNCNNSFTSYTLPLLSPLSTSIKPAIQLLTSNLCTTQHILGGYSDVVDLWTYVKDLRCADDEGLIPDYTQDLNSLTGIGSAPGIVNTYKYLKVAYNAICNLNNKFNVLTQTLSDCCKADCDTCLMYNMGIKEFNYGIFTASPSTVIPGALITDNSKPQIVFDENITLNCQGEQLDNNLSKYIISDGIRILSYSLNDLINGVPGITILSGTVGSNAVYLLDLQLLGLSYLANITIRQKLKTIIYKCDSSEKILIPGYTGKSCGKCVVCIKKRFETDINEGSVTFSYNGETYYLDLNNPCISIPLYTDPYGNPIPIVGIKYSSDIVVLTSECPEFGLAPFCEIDNPDTNTEENKCKWYVDLSLFMMYTIDLNSNNPGYYRPGESLPTEAYFKISYKVNGGSLVVVNSNPYLSLHDWSSPGVMFSEIQNTLSLINGVDNIIYYTDQNLIEFCADKSLYFYNLLNIADQYAVSSTNDTRTALDVQNADEPGRLTLKSKYRMSSLFQKECDCCVKC